MSDTSFKGDDLLGTQRDLGGLFRGKGQRLIKAIGGALSAASTATNAWKDTRMMLFSGCWAVKVLPPVWAWKRKAQLR